MENEKIRNPYEAVLHAIALVLANAIASAGYNASEEDIKMSISPSKLLGDISSSIAFKLASNGDVPQKVAEKIAFFAKPPDMVESVSPERGFINFYLSRTKFSLATLLYALFPSHTIASAGRRVIVEYPSVNPNKPWHIGHLRNALLGNAIANIYEYSGYEVKREDYIDDLGAQVIESLWGYMNLGKSPDKKFDHWIGEEYVDVNKRLGEKEVVNSIKKLAIEAEKQGTNEARILAELSQKCVIAQRETAFSYGI
ncbi:MAG: arginine--tRNA ligase, partial [Candidatus Micrarchaeaceae archaeon]